ncbi:hypothetical protein CMO89_04045 [Candidatus Woesearchaeota archaeon]|nr:hypothetical protein [Candidatus Woesearchaeota archaeon]|tara:strand:- start:10595 stop:11182 length:588 start_codon:yes stop_codon:yes gene_type:complete
MTNLDFKGFFGTLESWGLTDALLPFLLIFTIIFAILQKTKVIGEDKKNIHVVIALVIALLVVIPHIINPGGPADVVGIINQAIPHVSLVIVAIVMLLILVGVFGKDIDLMGTSFAGWIAIASFGLIIYIFGAAAGWGWNIPNWLGWLRNESTQALVLIILVFGVIIWLITKESRPKQEKTTLGNLVKKIGDSVKK